MLIFFILCFTYAYHNLKINFNLQFWQLSQLILKYDKL
jgi:hypothetical protein